MESKKLQTWDIVRAFVLAGNATFTLVSIKTGTRFTYKVTKAENGKRLYFVKLLGGPDNESDYRYMGVLDSNGAFRRTAASKVGESAPSYKAFAWFWSLKALPSTIEVWHEGRCGMCGRKLTVPESLERGIGPDCAGRMAA